METKQIVRFAMAAAAAMMVSACATTERQLDEEFVVTPCAETKAMAECDYTKAVDMDVKPGVVYICPGFANVFDLSKMESNVTEDGLLSVRVYGKTLAYPPMKWLFQGEKPYRVAFQFLWFDKNGKLVKLDKRVPLRMRECMPGETLRFSAVAPLESVTSFSFAVGMLHDEDEICELEEGLKVYSAEMDRTAPAEADNSTQVKIEK